MRRTLQAGVETLDVGVFVRIVAALLQCRLIQTWLSVKIEVNTVMRGTVHPVRPMALSAAASDALMADLEQPPLSADEIYGGKLVAAMDRQHPRDLFDVM